MTDVNGTLYEVRPTERRINPYKPELRSSEGKPSRIVGYASVFGKLSRSLGGFVEQVNKAAFRSSKLDGWPDVVCRYNHSDDFVLGTIQGGTLAVDYDETGLMYDVVPPNAQSGILELCQRGDIRSSSFAFWVPVGGDEWREWQGNTLLRTLLAVKLVDVAPVITPAYPDATAALRSTDGAVLSLAARFDADPTEIRSLLSASQGVKLFKRSDRPSVPAVSAVPGNSEENDMAVAEIRDKLTSKERDALPKSSFAYVDPDGVGHFPIHDASHVRNALARIAQGAQYGQQALPKVKAAAKKFGIDTAEQNNLFSVMEEMRGEIPDWLRELSDAEDRRLDAEDAEERAAAKAKGTDSTADDEDEADDADEDESGKGVEGEQRSDEDETEEERAAKAKAAKAKADSKPDDDEDEDEDDDDSSTVGVKGNNKGSGDTGKPVGKGLPAFLENKNSKRMLDLLGKRYDPYVDEDEA